ncbi:erythromycin esterase family protein [Paenibacillus sp. UMB4589-SE434]|uniref:erythromycin esterase family protein n=1 Tax=Paenibacillus sp. UMB4589-SE434 TaxID=3046314 RepID=UPI002549E682|nr:erythromycin esterase family protein [Paenibacillus sp. UMB4589-SE434]MDK8181266.1 erythromycin esterase family protein [Paenibacillus sp. UMB4589-SE434]
MNTQSLTWKKRGLSLFLATIMTLGTLLSYTTTVHGAAAESKEAVTAEPAAQNGAQAQKANEVKAADQDGARTSTETRQDWQQWMKSNAIALKTIKPEATKNAVVKADQFKDLAPLKTLLKDKRIVYLGESSHGAAEYNSVKTRLIQYMHQELGFNVVAFETNLGNAASAYGNVKSKKPVQTMKDSIFRIWQAEETVPLFQYIQDTQKTKKPLALAGFDMQPQGPLFSGEWMGDAKLAKRFQEAELELDRWEQSEDLAAYAKAKPKLLNVYQQVRQITPKRAAALRRQFPDNPHIVKMVERALDNRIQVVKEYMETTIASTGFMLGKSMDYQSVIKSSEYRDRMMADNLVWLATNVYPKEKMIVWAHNGHISKAYSKELNSLPRVHMGELMQKTKFKDQSYVMGLYMGGGKNAHVTGEIFDVLPPMAHSIEEVMKGAGHRYSFVDMRYKPETTDNSWMRQQMGSYYTGVSPVSSVPFEQYDGILYIDQVSAPKYFKK